MQSHVVIEKKEGETPLSALEAYRSASGIARDVPMTYAGRLDPMASGKLLILIGDACKHRDAYDGLDKEYEFEILFGYTTDTGDVLGLADRCVAPAEVSGEKLLNIARTFLGKRTMSYPAFSSKTVRGKPLYEFALANRLHEIQIPSLEVSVYSLQLLDMRSLSSEELLSDIERRLGALRVDAESTNPHKEFRRDDILARWREHLEGSTSSYQIARLRIAVSSGTYIRSLAPVIAEELGLCGLAYSIRRTRIGRYRAYGPVHWWSPSY